MIQEITLYTVIYMVPSNFISHGTAMGSPISVVVGEIVMQNIKESVLSTCPQIISLWLHYVDDTFVAVRHDEINAFHLNHHLN